MISSDLNGTRQSMLMEVNRTSFAEVEAALYLDTHPCDAAAISYHNQMAQACKTARSAYEARFGPLLSSDSADTSHWSWVQDPWPWEGGAC